MGTQHGDTVPRWGRFQSRFTSSAAYADPFQDARLSVIFTAPSGAQQRVEGFWDGGDVWRVRFSPTEPGTWTYTTVCTNPDDSGLHHRSGGFECGAPAGGTRFRQHGPLRLSANRRYLVHADGTPFLWLGDTGWNGPLRATPAEWAHYLAERARQQFNTVQWVCTQWVAAPDGDRLGQLAFTGHDRIALNPAFFQRLDTFVDMLEQAGMLSVPVLLWAVRPGNPGHDLPIDQALILARYMVARWGDVPTVWILPGDGDYRGNKAERWKYIGQAIFGDMPDALVSLHPGGMQWNCAEFQHEPWLDLIGYQSGHGDDQRTLAWLVEGPPARDWPLEPARPFINLEPPYEDHVSYQSQTRLSADFTRRALYWSLLITPPAGVTYGGHGIWGWDDGSAPPVGHANTGVPLPWQQALLLPGAEQMAHLADLFGSLEWWRLSPAPELVHNQPGDQDKGRFIAAAKAPAGDLIAVYVPADREFDLNLDGLPDDLSGIWFDPRTGARQSAALNGGHFTTPAAGDWVLVLARAVSLPAGHGDHSS
jgi:hypothetical protein